VSAIYRNCDCTGIAQRFEPWALVINEAAAAGMAIISSMSSVPRQSWSGMVLNGPVVPAGELSALIRAILEVTMPDAD